MKKSIEMQWTVPTIPPAWFELSFAYSLYAALFFMWPLIFNRIVADYIQRP